MHTDNNKNEIKGQLGTLNPKKHLVMPCGEGLKKKSLYFK